MSLQSPRVSLSAGQTQALTSLLATIGPYLTIDIREGMSGAIFVTVYRDGDYTLYRLGVDGETREVNDLGLAASD